MLHTDIAVPFPQVGSYGLLAEGGETHLALILSRNDRGEALVSLPLSGGASGNRNVPIAALQDGTPLTAQEMVEFAKLVGKRNLAVREGRRFRHTRRYDELSARNGNATLLTRLRDQLARTSQRRAA